MGFDWPDNTHDQGGQSQNEYELKGYEQEPGYHPESPYIATSSKRMSVPKMYARYNDKLPAWITRNRSANVEKNSTTGLYRYFRKTSYDREFKVSPLREIVGFFKKFRFEFDGRLINGAKDPLNWLNKAGRGVFISCRQIQPTPQVL